jgi:hypothetical protein
MNQTEPLSISLFKQKINKLQPNYSIFDSEKVFNTLEYLFSLNTDESRLFIEQEFNIKTADFLEDYIFELADIYIQNSNINDPIISLLIKSNYLPFVSKIEFSKDLQISMQRIERKRLKAILISNEIIQDEKDLKIVFQRIDRKTKKNELQEIEENNNQESKKQKTNWRFLMSIAALFILILLPFLNSNSVYISKSSIKNESKILYAETGDLKDLYTVNIPEEKITLGSTQLKTNQLSQGFGPNNVDNIIIQQVSVKNQLIYLENKIEILDTKYQELKSKKIKDKQSTLESIKESKVKCTKEKIKLLALESTYEFKDNNLKLFKQEKIDLKSINVYSLNDEDEHKLYYLRIGEDYFSLQIIKGKLIKVVEEGLIEKLEATR